MLFGMCVHSSVLFGLLLSVSWFCSLDDLLYPGLRLKPGSVRGFSLMLKGAVW